MICYDIAVNNIKLDNDKDFDLNEKTDDIITYFYNQTDIFISSINTTAALNYLLYWHGDLADLEFVSLKRYYD